MRRHLKILALLLSSTGLAWAASPSSQSAGPLPASVGLPQPAAAVGEGVLQTTTLRNNSQPVFTPGGYQSFHDPNVVSVTCPPGPGTCIVEFDQYVQVGNSQVSGNRFAICSKIDGRFVSQPPCPFLGEVPTAGYVGGSFMQFQTAIRPGTHRVNTYLYTDDGATRSYSSVAYRVYKRN